MKIIRVLKGDADSMADIKKEWNEAKDFVHMAAGALARAKDIATRLGDKKLADKMYYYAVNLSRVMNKESRF